MIRKLFAVISGIISGVLLSAAVQVGLRYRFPQEVLESNWGFLFWGEHWFLRTLASALCAAWAGFMAGLIGRAKGGLLGMLAVLPAWVVWLATIYVTLTGKLPFFNAERFSGFHVSIGNKIFMWVIILIMIPIACIFGNIGEVLGQKKSEFFDSKPHSILGIKWYHYLWITPLLYLILIQASFSSLYFLPLLKEVIRWQRPDLIAFFRSIVPLVLCALVGGTFLIMAIGIINTYKLLTGIVAVPSRGIAFLRIFKYAFGFQCIAVILQLAIEYMHFTVAKWLS